MKEDSAYLNHISDSIYKIKEYSKDSKFEDFYENTMMQDAIIRQLLIIGEAVKLLSQEVKSKNKDIPWKDIAGMRDKLIHNYFGVDIEAVWKTINEDLDSLTRVVKNLLKK